MQWIDTHAHLYAQAFDQDRSLMLDRAFAQGLSHVFLPNIDLESVQPMLDLAAAYPQQCFPMMGLHPCSVQADWEEQLSQIHQHLSSNPQAYWAIGEIGIDLYWSRDWEEAQIQAFENQCLWALTYDLPIVVHARESLSLLIDLVRAFQARHQGALRGIFHCFTGDAKQAQELINLGFLLGIGGVLTYKKSDLPSVLAEIPLNALVLETDSPYLPPHPHRGKRNESAYLPLIGAKLAQIYGLELEQIAEITSQNALNLFGLN